MLKMTETNQKWWVLAAMSACLALIFLDQTAVAVILPQLQRDFGISSVMLQWVVNAYLLSLAVLIVIGGKCGDIFGRRRMFLIGVTGFMLASLSCGAAPSGMWLVISRAVQGGFGALLIPNAILNVMHAFPVEERGKAVGMYVGFSAIFLAIGPFVGGAFTQLLSWRLVFWINIPTALFSLYVASATLPKNAGRRERIDWFGFLTLGVATGSLVFALMEGVVFGWDSSLIIGLFVAALIGYITFFIIEHRVTSPLIDFQLFRRPGYASSVFVISMMQICIMSTVFWVILFQDVMGYSPLIAGLMVMPSTVPSVLMSPLAGRLLDRFGPKLPVGTGLVCATFGLFWIFMFAATGSYLYLLPGVAAFGIGLPMIMSPSVTFALSSVHPDQRGQAAGVMGQLRQIAATTGFAVIGAVIGNVDRYRFQHFLGHAGFSAHHAAAMSYTAGFRYGMVVAVLVAASALVVALTKLRKRKSVEEKPSSPLLESS